MKRFCLALDLIEDAGLIARYEQYHQAGNVWPEITKSIRESGILNLEIYRLENRLTMIMETEDYFSFEKKDRLDKANPSVQKWEKLMWQFQKPLPWANKGEKWVLMNKMYELQ